MRNLLSFRSPLPGRYAGLLVMLAAPLVPVAAQQPAPSAADPAALLLEAAKQYGLGQPGSKPWRLKAAFALLDAQGNPTDAGTYELLWIGPFQYKQIYSSKAFTQTQYAVPGQILFTGNPAMAPQATFWLRAMFASPIAGETVITRSHIESHPPAAAAPGSSSACYDLRAERQPANWPALASYCFDAQNHLVAFTVGYPRMGDATFDHPVEFYGHLLAGDVLMKQNGVPVLRAHLESVSWLTGADQPEMQPPPDAQPWHPQTPVVGKTTAPAGSGPAK